jgi:hypothetical protein
MLCIPVIMKTPSQTTEGPRSVRKTRFQRGRSQIPTGCDRLTLTGQERCVPISERTAKEVLNAV